MLATVLEKEIGDGPQTTGMAVSETLTLLPSAPGRHRCSWPGPLFKAPSTLQQHLLQALDLRDAIFATQGPFLTAPSLIKFCA